MECSRCGGDLYLGSRHCHGGTYRYERIKTPAAVEIITDKQIRETGAANMQEALKFSTGIITSSQGPRGLSQGTMTAKAVIRGVEKVRSFL